MLKLATLLSAAHLARGGEVGAPDPATLPQVDCAVNQLAFQFGAPLMPNGADSLWDALNLETICAQTQLDDATTAALAKARDVFGRNRPSSSMMNKEEEKREAAAASIAFYVSPSGSDSNPGTIDAPFKTLTAARDAVRGVPVPQRISAGGAAVYLRAGTYYLDNTTLALDASDSYVAWQSYQGEAVSIAGSRSLTSLSWAPVGSGPIMSASVKLPDPRFDAWVAAGGVKSGTAPPPMVISQLFVSGQRQIRARYPNGNPADNSGLCFSKTQRPGEGCNGYSRCSTGDGGKRLVGPPAVAKVQGNLNRGNSPTQGCPQCTTYGNFQYSIFPPPPNHPVYDKPLPGIGWDNTSHFTFWGSLFDRSGAMQVDTGCDPHFAGAAKWTNTELSYLNTFHNSLWGGWSFALSGASVAGNTATLDFAYGGYQEARGGYFGRGGAFFVENILEELDAPGEWYYNPYAGQLYVYPNVTASNLTDVSVPLLQTLVSITGQPGAPAVNISFAGITFTQSAMTEMEQYEVPSGGERC